MVGAGLYGFAYKPGYAYNPSSMPAEVKKCGGNKFNPFNVDDATCIFAEKFKKALRNSQIVAQGGKTGSELRQTMGLLISFEVAGGDSQRAFSTFESLKNSGGDCNKMNGDAVAMCCEYKRTQNGAGYVFMPNRVGCSAQDIGSFMSAFASRHGKHDAYAASSYYATLYSKCEDCYLGSWKKNVCDEAKAVGITLPEC
ncbi:MAG: hypothetical protein D6769_01155 [Methanobacteriota archaeon]|nr:MAG: hypothetical protein D6769_01155 [Euryarchaeota archaeon]